MRHSSAMIDAIRNRRVKQAGPDIDIEKAKRDAKFLFGEDDKGSKKINEDRRETGHAPEVMDREDDRMSDAEVQRMEMNEAETGHDMDGDQELNEGVHEMGGENSVDDPALDEEDIVDDVTDPRENMKPERRARSDDPSKNPDELGRINMLYDERDLNRKGIFGRAANKMKARIDELKKK